MTKLIVTAPAVQLKVASGQYVTLYQGAPVPSDADADQVGSLKDSNMVGEADADVTTDSSDAPAKSATKAEWVAYATDEARGDDRLSVEDAEALTRDELAAKYKA